VILGDTGVKILLKNPENSEKSLKKTSNDVQTYSNKWLSKSGTYTDQSCSDFHPGPGSVPLLYLNLLNLLSIILLTSSILRRWPHISKNMVLSPVHLHFNAIDIFK
jgi:hypothetical protein